MCSSMYEDICSSMMGGATYTRYICPHTYCYIYVLYVAVCMRTYACSSMMGGAAYTRLHTHTRNRSDTAYSSAVGGVRPREFYNIILLDIAPVRRWLDRSSGCIYMRIYVHTYTYIHTHMYIHI
jgi:hypothetical protein